MDGRAISSSFLLWYVVYRHYRPIRYALCGCKRTAGLDLVCLDSITVMLRALDFDIMSTLRAPSRN